MLGSDLNAGINVLKKAEVQNRELRLVFESWLDTGNVKKMELTNPPRTVIDIKNARLSSPNVASGLNAGGVEAFRISQFQKDVIRVVIETGETYRCVNYQPMSSRSFYHISLPKNSSNNSRSVERESYRENTSPPVIEEKTPEYEPPVETPEQPVFIEEEPEEERGFFASLFGSRKKGPKGDYTIIVDAGHGGHDSGAVGDGRYQEKIVVLEIAKKVQQELKDKGFTVRMSRSNDRFVQLKNRTKFANSNNADIFVSIHANAVANQSRKEIVHGIETYFLQKTRSEKAKRLAAMENVDVLSNNDHVTNEVLLDSIISGPKLVQSNKLAIDIQNNMIKKTRSKFSNVRDGGVRPAPFYVLVGAQMPSVLVEVGYISNSAERARIFTPSYQDKLAEGIADGVSNYLLNHEKDVEQ